MLRNEGGYILYYCSTRHTIDKRIVSYLVGHRDGSKGGYVEKFLAQSTQSGIGHFLANIPSMRVKSAKAGDCGGGVQAHPFHHVPSRTKL